MTARNLCPGTGLAAVVYHFRGWSTGVDTFGSRCPQRPISVPGTGREARPQVGTKVASAPHHAFPGVKQHPNPLSISRSGFHAVFFTYLSAPTHPGFLVAERTYNQEAWR